MRLKYLSLALLSGIAAFLIVGATVTEFAQSWIEFSLFLGIPVGLVTGAVTAAAVYLGLADDAPVSRRVAVSVAAFGVGFLIALVVFGWLLNIGVTTALIVSVVVALAVAVVAYLRGRKTSGATIDDDSDTPSRVT
jgi:hypothetical protein